MCNKGKHGQMKRKTYWMGENICKQHDQQRVNIQYIQAAYKTQHQNKQTTQLKGGQKTQIEFFWKRECRWPIGTWKDAQDS